MSVSANTICDIVLVSVLKEKLYCVISEDNTCYYLLLLMLLFQRKLAIIPLTIVSLIVLPKLDVCPTSANNIVSTECG